MTETKTFVARLREYARGGRQSETETLNVTAENDESHAPVRRRGNNAYRTLAG